MPVSCYHYSKSHRESVYLSHLQIQQMHLQRDWAKRRSHLAPPSPAGILAKCCTTPHAPFGLWSFVHTGHLDGSLPVCHLSQGWRSTPRAWMGGALFWSCPLLDSPLRQPGAQVCLGIPPANIHLRLAQALRPCLLSSCPSYHWIPQSHWELQTGHISQGLWRPSCFWCPPLPALLTVLGQCFPLRQHTHLALPHATLFQICALSLVAPLGLDF